MYVELVPRWLWQEVAIPQSGEVIVDPSNFANTTPYPMRLHWLSICGKAAVSGAPYDELSGGVTRRFNVEVGITGYSDVNLVPMVGSAFFCARRVIQKDYNGAGSAAHSANVFIPRALRIPKDGGLVVEIQNISNPDDYTVAKSVYGGYLPIFQPSIVAQGYHDESKIPGFLAGRIPETLLGGGPQRFNCSDLLNQGREDFIITSVNVDSTTATPGYLDVQAEEVPTLNKTAWRINPVTGIQWMPQPDPIPTGCIAPFTRTYDANDEGPKVYEFPKNVVLTPRQRLGVKFTDQSSSAQTIYVCLHGELEVR